MNFDARDGHLLDASFAAEQLRNKRDLATAWLIWLHTGAVFGLPLQVLLFAMGLVITALSITGIYLWWKKRRAKLGVHVSGMDPQEA